ncbi:hypothetical protein NQ318_022863 [Aromia moschata]|uniref:Uncharacterized protein n=1 Tax=Aromia moschata TaxID=1265417 RepID=A0AAV8Y5P9_9CUCU|nr:hypothetical protein NQ318_022863 [Aromia moschata]
MFLNGLNGLKRDVKRPKMICALDGSQRQKRTKTLKKIGKLIREDHRLSIRRLAEITGIDKECVRQILHESFNMRKVCAQMVTKLLTPEQKESRLNIYADILNNIDADPGLIDTVTLKGTRFESVEAVKAKATEVLNQLTEADFQYCLQQWRSRMERCRNRQGEYIEVEKVATILWMLNFFWALDWQKRANRVASKISRSYGPDLFIRLLDKLQTMSFRLQNVHSEFVGLHTIKTIRLGSPNGYPTFSIGLMMIG